MAKSATSDSHVVKRTELLVFSEDKDLVAIANEAAEFFSFNIEHLPDLTALEAESEFRPSPQMVFLSFDNTKGLDETARVIGRIFSLYSRAQIVLAIDSAETDEVRQRYLQHGADRLLTKEEVKNSSKFFYLCSLLIRGAYLPIQVMDLFPSTQVEFNAYHKLPINQKYLPVIFAGFVFSDKKYRRLEAFKQVYVRREELDSYRKYIEAFHDRRGNALKKRCRATMMSLIGVYTELVVLLTTDVSVVDTSTLASYIDRYKNIVRDLADYFKECPDVWNVISQSLDFQFCTQERGPAVVAYAVYIAQMLTLPNISEIAMAVLLSDLGFVGLPSGVYKDIITTTEARMTEENRDHYRKHPQLSLALAKKNLTEEISPHLEEVVLCTHERVDGKGFPRQVEKEKIPFESQLILFCETLDRRARASLDGGFLTHDFVRKQLWEEEKNALTCFNADFLDKIEKLVVTPVA